MAHWLFKSEPNVFGWPHQVALGDKGGEWYGVRNYGARNNMRAMKVGDQGFFYHSNIGKEIVGILEVIRESAQDTTTEDPRWDCVMVKAVRSLLRPITINDCKDVPGLESMVLINNSRLSVQPVTDAEWDIICRLGG